MIKNIRNYSALLLAGFFMVACGATVSLAPTGVYKINDKGQEVTLDRDWNDGTLVFNNNKTKTKLLTIDGIYLNRVYLSQGLTSSEPLFIGPKGNDANHVAPRPLENMSLSEQMQYVASALSEIQYLKIETKSPKPVTISGQKGIRFELTMRNEDGLDINGIAQAVAKDGKNYYIIYLAPKEHYYNANLKNAVAIMDSQKLP